jgi:hypothetical protein
MSNAHVVDASKVSISKAGMAKLAALVPTSSSPVLDWKGEDNLGRECKLRMGYDLDGNFEVQAEVFEDDFPSGRWLNAKGDDRDRVFQAFLKAHFPMEVPA